MGDDGEYVGEAGEYLKREGNGYWNEEMKGYTSDWWENRKVKWENMMER